LFIKQTSDKHPNGGKTVPAVRSGGDNKYVAGSRR